MSGPDKSFIWRAVIKYMGQGLGAAGVGDGLPGPAQHSPCEEKVQSALYSKPDFPQIDEPTTTDPGVA